MKPELSLSEVRSRVIRLPGRPPFMLARDLASLYRVPPSRIGWAVHRNPERFPEPDFCFRISREEAAELQICPITSVRRARVASPPERA